MKRDELSGDRLDFARRAAAGRYHLDYGEEEQLKHDAFLAGAGVQEHWEALNPRPAPVTESAIEAVAEHLWKSDGADDSLEWSGQTPEVCEDYRQRARSVLSVAGHASALTQDDLTRFKAAWESADALGMAGRRVEAGMVALGLTVEAP